MPQGELTIGSVLRAGQQPEPVPEPVAHLGRAHGRHPRRGQLDAQGEPVERLADLDHSGRGPLVEDAEPGPDRARPLHEQGHGIGGHPAVQGERRDRHHRLTGHPQVLARRRQDPRRLGAGEDLPDRRSGRRQEVLAVVDHDQQPTSGDRVRDGVDDGGVALRCDPEGVGDRVGYGVGLADRCELDQPHAVREPVIDLGGGRQGQPRLADPADTAQGHQLMGAQQRRDLRQRLVAADERRGGPRHVAAPSLPAHAVSVAPA